MGCLGCQKLENDKYCVTLHTGKIVCNYCHEWLIECEANQILAMPLEERRKFLDQIEKKTWRYYET